MCKRRDCLKDGVRRKASEGLVVVAGVRPVTERLADVAVGPLVALAAVVGGVRRGVGHLHLGGAVLGVVEIEAVADVAEQPRGELLLGGAAVVGTATRGKGRQEGKKHVACRQGGAKR